MAAPVAARAAGYGMPGVTVDGTDVDAVWTAASDAMARARDGDGPALVELCVPRMLAHSSQDDESYRTDEERAALVAADPLVAFRRRVVDEGVQSQVDVDAAVASIAESVRDDAHRALDAPDPTPDRLHRWLYA
jgi:TPP-dependent pyruvate/acetoin dehydrogenase alpha subunit